MHCIHTRQYHSTKFAILILPFFFTRHVAGRLFLFLRAGSGTFGSVKEAVKISTGKKVAVKIIPKKNVKNHEEMVYKEMDVLKGLSHPNVIEFYDWFESRYVLIILDF